MRAREHWILGPNNELVPVSLMEWAMWFESNHSRRKVASDQIENFCVSTVFLGIDHNFFDDGPPLLFETMIFGPGQERDCWRYATWSEAQAGHDYAVHRLKQFLNDSPQATLGDFRLRLRPTT